MFRRTSRPSTLPDFQEVPVEALVQCLRQTGLRALQAALTGRASSVAADRRQRRPSYSERFQHILQRLSGQAAQRAPFGPPAQSAWIDEPCAQLLHSLQSQVASTARSYPDAVAGAVRGRLPIATWQEVTSGEFRRQLGLNEGYTLSAPLWEMVTEWAWNDLAFCREVANLLEDTLRRQTLFVLDDIGQIEFPTFRLSPHTFWLLLALITTNRLSSSGAIRRANFLLRLLQRWRSKRIQTLQTAVILGDLGRRYGLRSGWAKTWDQWVLVEAYLRWSSRARVAALEEALLRLPLATAAGLSPNGAVAGVVDLAAVNWEADEPAWFHAWWERRFQERNNYAE